MSKSKKSGARKPGNPAKRNIDPGIQRLYDRAQPTGNNSPLKFGGSISGPGGPWDHGQVVIDSTDALLLESMDVAAVDTFSGGKPGDRRVFMTLAGRINKTTTQAQVGVMFGSDGAAAIISQLFGLFDRMGEGMLNDLVERLVELDADNHISLAFLEGAIALARATRETAAPDQP